MIADSELRIDIARFKKRIHDYSVHNNISILELEKRVGMGNSSVRNILYEKSKRPRIRTLKSIADVLSCSIADLVGKKYAEQYPHLEHDEDDLNNKSSYEEELEDEFPDPWGLEEDQEDFEKIQLNEDGQNKKDVGLEKKEDSMEQNFKRDISAFDLPWYAHWPEKVSDENFQEIFNVAPYWQQNSQEAKNRFQYGVFGDAWYGISEKKQDVVSKPELFATIVREALLIYKKRGKPIPLENLTLVLQKAYQRFSDNPNGEISLDYVNQLFEENS